MKICWFVVILGLFFSRHVFADLSESPETTAKFPEPLKEKEFMSRTGLHVVEFYSPYCGHCKSLAPVWKDTWETFHEEGKRLNISLSQVNCFVSGDLCSEEKIPSYPSIRLYGPRGFIESFPSGRPRSKENLIDFARQAVKEPSNLEVETSKSLSELISAGKFANLLAGQGDKPYLVSFWPTKNTRSSSDLMFENCDECEPFQKAWKVLSVSLAASNISTGHVNCQASPTLCEKLGFSDLVQVVNHRADRYPGVALVIPGQKTNNLFIYEGPFSSHISVYEDFAKRTLQNSKLPKISGDDVMELVDKDFKVYHPPGSTPSEGKIHVVFSYHPDTVVPEDILFLENLVEPISKIPNAYLYKTEEDMISAVQMTFGSMYKLINYKKDEPKKIPREEYIDLNVMPKNPNIYIFRDADKIPHVFSGFSTTELRNLDYIMSWIKKYSLPVVNEVTPNNFKQLLNFEPDTYSALAIGLVNTDNLASTGKSIESLKELMIGAYDYEDVRMGKMIDDISTKRKQRLEKANALKKSGAKTDAVLEAARKEIVHKDDMKVILGYLDISQHPIILQQLGLKNILEEDWMGRVILVDKHSKTYYETDVFGDFLFADPYKIRETFVNVLLHDKSAYPHHSQGHVLGPPYSDPSKALDLIRMNGIWGYALVICLTFTSYKGIRIYKKRKIGKRYSAKRNMVGLLGASEKSRSKD